MKMPKRERNILIGCAVVTAVSVAVIAMPRAGPIGLMADLIMCVNLFISGALVGCTMTRLGFTLIVGQISEELSNERAKSDVLQMMLKNRDGKHPIGALNLAKDE